MPVGNRYSQQLFSVIRNKIFLIPNFLSGNFEDDTDRYNFITRLGDILLETKTPCYAWALIPNHFHILTRTGGTPLATVMRRLLTGYAVSFNRRHKRSGHLFQNRYKSILCQEDTYLLELVRYIHLNPLRAGIVSDLKQLARFGVVVGTPMQNCVSFPFEF